LRAAGGASRARTPDQRAALRSDTARMLSQVGFAEADVGGWSKPNDAMVDTSASAVPIW
jgi:hypothetical protein